MTIYDDGPGPRGPLGDTTPTADDIHQAAGNMHALVPPTAAVIGDLSATWPVLAGYLADILGNDLADPRERIVMARAALRGREIVADRLATEAAREREASREPSYGRPLAERITAGDLDWLIAIYNDGQTFECGICGGVVRAFEDDQAARAAARRHLIDAHLDGIAEMETTAVVSADLIEAIENDGRCQPIGCGAGVHLPGCQYDDPGSAQ